jgi:hypothetical protein
MRCLIINGNGIRHRLHKMEWELHKMASKKIIDASRKFGNGTCIAKMYQSGIRQCD